MSKNVINTALFAERFSDILSQTGITTYEVANALSLSPPTISRYANGIMKPKVTTLYALADYLKVNPLWLMGNENEKKEAPASSEQELNGLHQEAISKLDKLPENLQEEALRYIEYLLGTQND